MDDLISRQDAIDALYNASEDLSDNMWSVNLGITCEKMVEVLNNLPSAELPKGEFKDVSSKERKHGKWIPVLSDDVHGSCSECGFEAHYYEDDVYGYDYCPNCGSYNGGGKNEA